MGFFCLYLMRIALELAEENPVYEGVATKFFEHFVYIGAAMKKMGGRNYQLWDETDGFFYDVLRFPNGEFHKFRLRSLVGLIPLYAVEVLEHEELQVASEFSCAMWNGLSKIVQTWLAMPVTGSATETGVMFSRSRILPSSSACCNASGIRMSFFRRTGSAVSRNIIASTRFNSVTALWDTNLGKPR